MSLQPAVTAASGISEISSQLRSADFAYVAAGVACVIRAVEIMPVDLPAISASSSAVTSSLPATVLQSPRSMSSSTPITPTSVLIPLIIAVIVPAESGVCASTL